MLYYLYFIKMGLILPGHMLELCDPSLLALVPLQRGDCWQSCNRALGRSLEILQIHLNGGHIVLVKLQAFTKVLLTNVLCLKQ